MVLIADGTVARLPSVLIKSSTHLIVADRGLCTVADAKEVTAHLSVRPFMFV